MIVQMFRQRSQKTILNSYFTFLTQHLCCQSKRRQSPDALALHMFKIGIALLSLYYKTEKTCVLSVLCALAGAAAPCVVPSGVAAVSEV